MTPDETPPAPSVAIVGGGLAGLAAAVALGSAGCRVELFEARRNLGGRAASFRDPATGELVDHCQHVSMGCCTNLADFCRRTGIDGLFRSDDELCFIGPGNRQYHLRAARWLPAPLHLAAAFWGLKFLTAGDRLRIGMAMWRLARMRPRAAADQLTIGEWLTREKQSKAAIDRFWSVVLTSALGEELDRASLGAARKVIVDGFLANRRAHVVEVPRVALGTLYGERLQRWLAEHHVELHTNAPVRQAALSAGRPMLALADGQQIVADFVVIAVPWTKVKGLVSPDVADTCPWMETIAGVEASPITGVHLWFDRPIMALPHAVLVGRLSQWIFNRGAVDLPIAAAGATHGHYYQVVISASRGLEGRDRDEIVAEVCGELAAIWPAAIDARLVHCRVVTEPAAVFSARPGFERLRPTQQTGVPGVLVAGDWTATGWPATMESAVRSGYLAAEAILTAAGRPRKCLAPDLPKGMLARLLIAS